MRYLAILVLLAFATACPSVTSSRPAQSVIDCLKVDALSLANTATELRPLVFGDKPDWSGLYEKAKQAGREVGGCVLADLVQEYLGGRKSITPNASWSARHVLEEFRVNEAGNATFRTKAGDL